ncbi:hypothetical protein [Salana multivorans]
MAPLGRRQPLAPRERPGGLARQTGWPGWFWVGTQLLVIAAATALAGWLLWRTLT